MKIMAAARAALELLVIVANDCERVMTVDELKSAVLDETSFSREERKRLQSRLLSAITCGSATDLHFRKYSSPITNVEYLIPAVVEEQFSNIAESIRDMFATSPVTEVDLNDFKNNIINAMFGTTTTSIISRSEPTNRLTPAEKAVIVNAVEEQVTAPGYTPTQRLNIRKILHDNTISMEKYVAVQQYANKIKKNILGDIK